MTVSDMDHEVQRVADMHAVYRMYGAGRRLLYVGMTADIAKRIGSHAEKRWFPRVREIRLEWFPDRDTAAEAELRAIREERPWLNIAGRSLEPPRPRQELPPMPIGPVTLREAVAAGLLPTVAAARKTAHRQKWEPVGGDKCAGYVYSLTDLRAYLESRGRR